MADDPTAAWLTQLEQTLTALRDGLQQAQTQLLAGHWEDYPATAAALQALTPSLEALFAQAPAAVTAGAHPATQFADHPTLAARWAGVRQLATASRELSAQNGRILQEYRAHTDAALCAVGGISPMARLYTPAGTTSPSRPGRRLGRA